MAKQARYNGYANWATWNVALWIGNEEALYNAVRSCRPRGRISAGQTEDLIRELLPDGTPDMDSPAELRQVRWSEVAACIREL